MKRKLTQYQPPKYSRMLLHHPLFLLSTLVLVAMFVVVLPQTENQDQIDAMMWTVYLPALFVQSIYMMWISMPVARGTRYHGVIQNIRFIGLYGWVRGSYEVDGKQKVARSILMRTKQTRNWHIAMPVTVAVQTRGLKQAVIVDLYVRDTSQSDDMPDPDDDTWYVIPSFISAIAADYLLLMLCWFPCALLILLGLDALTGTPVIPWWFVLLGTIGFVPLAIWRFRYIKRIFEHGIYAEATLTFAYPWWPYAHFRFTYQGRDYARWRFAPMLTVHMKYKSGGKVPVVFDPKMPGMAFLVPMFAPLKGMYRKR